MKLKLILFLFAFSTLFAQVEMSRDKSYKGGKPNFKLDLINYKSDIPGKTRVDIFVQLPYSNIQFIKQDDDFKGKYSVTLTFLDSTNQNVKFERTWSEQVSANDFIQTTSQESFNLSYKSIELAPGKYNLKCLVEDNASRKSINLNAVANIKAMDDSVGLSDILLVSKTVELSEGEKIIPNVAKTVTSQDKMLKLYFEVYSDKPQTITLEYNLRGLQSQQVKTESEQVDIKAGTNIVKYDFMGTDFKLGEYVINVKMKDENGGFLSETQKKFRANVYGLPTSVADLDKAVEQMQYIASPEEIDQIQEAKTFSEKQQLFIDFWKSKDPSPKTEINEILIEYYRRIEYANEHFKSLYEGWRSDMGMVYVTFGPPDEVQRHPFDMDTKPYEVWTYFELSKQFVFQDLTGFGDYHLVNPDYSRWPGFQR